MEEEVVEEKEHGQHPEGSVSWRQDSSEMIPWCSTPEAAIQPASIKLRR